MSHTGDVAVAPDGERTIRTVAWRLLPLLAILYVVSFVDRVNIGIAALRMNADLGLSAGAYGLASGIFFVGYLAFQVPANRILCRLGARVWLTILLAVWGSCSTGTAFVTGPHSLYATRLALGVAEAGFFPAVIYYLGLWFPQKRRARATAAFMLAIPISNIIGAPISALLVEHGGIGTIPGWRTMFFIEGLTAVALGPLVLRFLPDGPEQAGWLTPAERDRIAEQLAAPGPPDPMTAIAAAPPVRRLLVLAIANAGICYAAYSTQFFLPQLIASRSGGRSVGATGLTIAVCYLGGAIAMAAWSRRCDRAGNPARHLAIPAVAGSIALLVALRTGPPALLAGVGIALVCTLAAAPVFWALTATLLTDRTGTGAATSIAAINAIASLSGFAGPYATGRLKDATGEYTASLVLVAAALAVTGLIALTVEIATRQAAPRRT